MPEEQNDTPTYMYSETHSSPTSAKLNWDLRNWEYACSVENYILS